MTVHNYATTLGIVTSEMHQAKEQQKRERYVEQGLNLFDEALSLANASKNERQIADVMDQVERYFGETVRADNNGSHRQWKTKLMERGIENTG
jgi:hypothetical protein